MQRKGFAITLVVTSFLFAACGLADSPSAPAENTPPPATQASLLGETKTYVDDIVGFAVDYPADWRLEATPGSTAILFSYQESEVGPGSEEVFPPGLGKIDIIPAYPDEPRKTVDDFINSAKEDVDDSEGRVVVDEQRLTLDGLPAARLTFTGGMGGDSLTPSVAIEFPGRLLFITGYGDTTLFDAIVGTFRRL